MLRHIFVTIPLFKYICIAIVLLIIGFILGWLFPIKGPYDIDDSDTIKVKKHAQRSTAINPKPVKEMLIDLNEDEIPEWYLLIPEFTGNE